ncbi:hypothetical protein AQ490_09520 [Wenjunlia vitaminophila]|uniref:Fe2OG dioxygenase domain-containing protein n=1 Tax=Wenjunlia vitaminophila TaxID=76728 RepID=A0A0T6LLP6_WENVI|nr:hypothetical protein [Wenjunlia vitaminophila]KRV46990.1 hypothetical protein AQ490_09520 [Wenjunlia vitaminophila]
MLTEPHFFPGEAPPGYSYLEDEPEFDPRTDLQLEPPQELTNLRDLGYDTGFEIDFPSPLAVTSALRVLSDTGVEKTRKVIKRLLPHAVHSPDPRVAPVLHGAVYRSRFLRDLSLSPEVAAFFSEIAGTDLVPTALPFNLAQINYVHPQPEQAIEGWHHDDTGLSMLLVVHDPSHLDGGRFQYFHGTRQEAAGYARNRLCLPADRVVSPVLPGPGYAVLMQGSALVHRDEPLWTPGERYTLGSCYDSPDPEHTAPNRTYFPDETDTDHLFDPETQVERLCRYVDFARHKAWRARGRLDAFLREVPWTDDRELIVRQLTEAVREVVEAVNLLRGDETGTAQVTQLRAPEESRGKRRMA